MDFRGELQADVIMGSEATELARGDNLLAAGTPNDAQLAAINERMPLVGTLSADDVFVWPIQAINSRTYAYHMWMDKSSLKNFVDGANSGRGYSYLRNHNQGEDPHGRVFAGVLRDDGPSEALKPPAGTIPFARDVMRDPGNVLRVYEVIYMPRGLVINGHSNDDLIRNLETGVQASNSVGFGVYSPLEPGSRVECDICGVDMFRSSYDDCPHFPGLDYEVKLGQGENDPKSVVTATARVMNAQQNEVSGVYLGAVPDTFTERALALHRGGLMSLKDARRIEDTYHLTRGRIVGDAQTIIDMGRGAVQYHGIPTGASVPATNSVQHGGQPSAEIDNKTGGESMQEMLARVRELLAGDPGRLAALELHKPEAEPLAAFAKVFEAEVDDERARAETALATHAAYQKAESEWLALAEGETVAQGRARKDGMAELGAKMFERMVGDYLTQRTRAGLPADEAAKAVAGQYSPDQLEAETKALKAAADKLYGPAGRVTEPTLENRPGNEATAPAARRRSTVRV